MRIDHLIEGRSVASAETFETRDPATQEVLAEVSSGGLNEVNQAVAAAKAAFLAATTRCCASVSLTRPLAGPVKGAAARLTLSE